MAFHSPLPAPVRFLVISDTASLDINNLPSHATFSPNNLRGSHIDVVLHCGSLSRSGNLPEYDRTLKLLGSIPAELRLVISGCRDHSLCREWMERHFGREVGRIKHGMAVEVVTGIHAQDTGVTFLTAGQHRFQLRSGAAFSVFAVPGVPEPYANVAHQFALQYYGQRGLTPATAHTAVPRDTDIIMSHMPASGMLDHASGKWRKDIWNPPLTGCESIWRACSRVRPLMLCCGHAAEGSDVVTTKWTDTPSPRVGNGAVQVRPVGSTKTCSIDLKTKLRTLYVNGAVCDAAGRAIGTPWVVTLDLPR